MDHATPNEAPPLDAPVAPVLVTGATGNVGRPLVAALLAAGARVRALTGDPAGASRRLGADHAGGRLECVRFDFTDPGTYAAALAGGGPLFLLRPPAISDARGAINPAVDVAVAAGVRRVAFLAVQGAERNPAVPHHAIERHLEELAAAGRVAYTFLRAAFFMQNLSTVHAADIRDLGEILVPAGDGRTAFVDAHDVGEAAARVLLAPAGDRTHANRGYELTSAEALTYDEVAATLTRVLGRPVAYRHPGAPVLPAHAAAGVRARLRGGDSRLVHDGARGAGGAPEPRLSADPRAGADGVRGVRSAGSVGVAVAPGPVGALALGARAGHVCGSPLAGQCRAGGGAR